MLRKVEGVTPSARRQFRINERKRHESLEEPVVELDMQGLGKLLVRRPQELLNVHPEPRGVAGASNSPRSTGRGRGRGKKEVRSDGSGLSGLH